MKCKKFFYAAFICSCLLVSLIACKRPTDTPIPIDNTPSIKICNQVWILKNLDVSNYRNGDPIPQVTDPTQWANLTTGAWCYLLDDAANGTVYGKLYNWYAVTDPRGLAPKGWHIPSVAEWATLQTCLGGDAVAGDKLRATGTIYWPPPNSGATNSSGFTALMGGNRNELNPYFSFNAGWWWSSTQYDTDEAWYHVLYPNHPSSETNVGYKKSGFSVRCIKD